MGNIRVLDKHTANLIAAGEVVERPAGAVKELLDNSADAKANQITVEIKRGGILFFRVTDNGVGIAKDDVPSALLRHATSKIATKEDLGAISTLGFRGEALAAIAAVSELKIMTKQKDSNLGTVLTSKNGEVLSVEETGCPDGTTVIVENIFENIPARLKFLKKDFTEGSAIVSVCEKFALSRPDIAISVISDGALKLQTPGDGNSRNAIYACLGKDFSSKLLPIEGSYNGVNVYGYIGRPEICRSNRNMQNFFVNKRYVRSKTMMAAIEQAFRSFCPTGKFPSCVLFIELDYSRVDVNIHPAKLEIKFIDEKSVFDTIYFAVRNALQKGILQNKEDSASFEENIFDSENKNHNYNIQKNYTEINDSFVKNINKEGDFNYLEKREKTRNQNNFSLKAPEKTISYNNFQDVFNPDFYKGNNINTDNESNNDILSLQKNENKNDGQLILSENEDKETPVLQETSFKYIGEAFNSYIIAETKSSLYLVDKHAAHERILYENLKNTKERGGAQVLLDPPSITLSSKEYSELLENSEYFENCGFEFENFGKNTVLLRTCPEAISISDAIDIFTFLAGSLESGNRKASGEIFDRILFSAACKAAVKAGDKNNPHNNEWILERIFSDEAVLYCPHGRPVLIEYTKEKLDKMFERL